jgi:hypothetical protein
MLLAQLLQDLFTIGAVGNQTGFNLGVIELDG